MLSEGLTTDPENLLLKPKHAVWSLGDCLTLSTTAGIWAILPEPEGLPNLPPPPLLAIFCMYYLEDWGLGCQAHCSHCNYK